MTVVRSEPSEPTEHTDVGMNASDSGPSGSDPRQRRAWGLLISLAVLWVLFLAYTLEALNLPWAAHNGYIGAGQFPRIVGCTGLLATTLAMVFAVRSGGRTASDVPVPGAPLRLGHPAVAITVASALLVLFLDLLGGLVAGVVYLYVCLSVLNRGHHVANAFIAVCFMGASYVLMFTLLNAPWPIGVLGV